MAIRRTKSLGTKVTEDEFAQCQAQAGTHTLSEWVRATLFHGRPPDPVVQALFAEVVALRDHPRAPALRQCERRPADCGPDADAD